MTLHLEEHFTALEAVRDVVNGMADGITVQFALAAGLAAAVSSTKIIATVSLAEFVAGASLDSNVDREISRIVLRNGQDTGEQQS